LNIKNSVKLTPSTVKGRKFESDIIVELPKCNFIVNLEQQNVYDPPARDKNNAYAYKKAIDQFESGKYGDKNIKKVIQLNFIKRFVKVGNLEGNYEMNDTELNKKQNDRLVEIRIIKVELNLNFPYRTKNKFV